MFLANIAVEGGLASYVGRHVLNALRSCVNDFAIRLAHTNVLDLDGSDGGLVSEPADTKLLNTCFRINFHLSANFVFGSTRTIERNLGGVLQVDQGLLGVIRFDVVGRRGLRQDDVNADQN